MEYLNLHTSYLEKMPRGKRVINGMMVEHFGGNSFLIRIKGENITADEPCFGKYDNEKKLKQFTLLT